jgi:hypothetical protein
MYLIHNGQSKAISVKYIQVIKKDKLICQSGKTSPSDLSLMIKKMGKD